MSRRASLLTLAIVLACAGTAPAVATPSKYAGSVYEHIWQAQSLYAGDAGQYEQRVIDWQLELRQTDEDYAGALSYQDVIAIVDGSGAVFSQEAHIEITLEGSQLSDTQAGGTFFGTAELVGRDAASVQEALAPPNEVAAVTEYAVTGHWGANVAADIAAGEILYETAVPVSVDGVVREVAWFNRSSLGSPDGLGHAQTFTTHIVEADSPSGDDEAADPDRTPATSAAPSAGGGDSSAGTRLRSAFTYIKKGLGGRDETALGWAPEDVVRAAKDLRDAHPAGATPLPEGAVSIDIEYSGAYIDTKNRAAGLLGLEGPTFEGAEELSAALATMRSQAPGIPALPPDVDAGQFWAQWAREAIRSHADVSGVEALTSELEVVQPGLDAQGVFAIRSTAMSALAAFRAPFGSVLAGVASSANDVAGEPLDPGALSDAVLAAAQDPRAPESATVVTEFARDESLDVDKDSTPPAGSVLGRDAVIGVGDGAVFGWNVTPGGEGGDITAAAWLGYVRADGVAYWLGEGTEAAVTDASLLGWAYSIAGRALVNANDVGEAIAYTPDAELAH